MPAEFVDNSPDSINRYFPQGNRGKPLQPWGHSLMKLSFSVKTAVSESRWHSGVLAPNGSQPPSPPHIGGTIALPDEFVDNSPDSINRLFHSRQPGCVPHVGTDEKRLWGSRPRSEGNRPTTFFRLSRRHPPLPRSLSFHSLMKLSGSDKKRCPRADGTRAFSRLTEANPLRPRTSGAQ